MARSCRCWHSATILYSNSICRSILRSEFILWIELKSISIFFILYGYASIIWILMPLSVYNILSALWAAPCSAWWSTTQLLYNFSQKHSFFVNCTINCNFTIYTYSSMSLVQQQLDHGKNILYEFNTLLCWSVVSLYSDILTWWSIFHKAWHINDCSFWLQSIFE